jgi:hypothetical protein
MPDGETLKDIHLPMLGDHNILNAMAALSIAYEMKVAPPIMKKALAAFTGVKRRFTKTGVSKDITIIDDYAHHPIEIETVLKAARTAVERRVVAAQHVQMHSHGRLGIGRTTLDDLPAGRMLWELAGERGVIEKVREHLALWCPLARQKWELRHNKSPPERTRDRQCVPKCSAVRANARNATRSVVDPIAVGEEPPVCKLWRRREGPQPTFAQVVDLLRHSIHPVGMNKHGPARRNHRAVKEDEPIRKEASRQQRPTHVRCGSKSPVEHVLLIRRRARC